MNKTEEKLRHRTDKKAEKAIFKSGGDIKYAITSTLPHLHIGDHFMIRSLLTQYIFFMASKIDGLHEVE